MAAKTKTRRPPIKDLLPVYAALVRACQKKGGTAASLANRLQCTKPTVYARIRALEVNGFTFKRKMVREGTHGPEAVHYSLR